MEIVIKASAIAAVSSPQKEMDASIRMASSPLQSRWQLPEGWALTG